MTTRDHPARARPDAPPTVPAEPRFDRLFQDSLAPSGIIDRAGVFQQVKPALCEALGVDADALIGRPGPGEDVGTCRRPSPSGAI